MKYDPQKHYRRSIRLKGYDYTQAGGYFITICMWQKQCLFGEIADKKMYLNRYGEVIQYNWFDLIRRYAYIQLDAFVIMPNHVHGIIWLLNPRGVGADLENSSVERTNISGEPAPTIHGDNAKSKSAKCCGLPEIIQGFKTASATRINQLRRTTGVAVWQRNYYEHIIRNDMALQNIRKYIINNPIFWQKDELNQNS